MAAAITAEGTTDEATMGVVDMAPDTDTIIDRDTATVAVMAADTTAGITAGAVAGTATVDITAGAAVITDSAVGTVDGVAGTAVEDPTAAAMVDHTVAVAGAVATAEAVDMAAVTGDTAKFPAPRSFWRSEIVSSFRAGSVGSSLFRIFSGIANQFLDPE